MNAIAVERKKPRTLAILEYGSKYVKVVVVIDHDDKYKWAFIDPKTGFPYHQYEGNYRSIKECTDAVEVLLTKRTRYL